MTENRHDHGSRVTVVEQTQNPLDHPRQRRAVALDLAIKALNGDRTTDVIELAERYEEYIRGEESAPAEDGEPGYGIYKDRDNLPHLNWEHSPRGWTPYTEMGRSGHPVPWHEVEHNAPFTRIGDLDG